MEKLTRIVAYIAGLYWFATLITCIVGHFAFSGAIHGQTVAAATAIFSVVVILLAILEAVRSR